MAPGAIIKMSGEISLLVEAIKWIRNNEGTNPPIGALEWNLNRGVSGDQVYNAPIVREQRQLP